MYRTQHEHCAIPVLRILAFELGEPLSERSCVDIDNDTI
jgi:hypothetical protein